MDGFKSRLDRAKDRISELKNSSENSSAHTKDREI